MKNRTNSGSRRLPVAAGFSLRKSFAINELNAKKRKLKLAATGVADTEQIRNLKVAATKFGDNEHIRKLKLAATKLVFRKLRVENV